MRHVAPLLHVSLPYGQTGSNSKRYSELCTSDWARDAVVHPTIRQITAIWDRMIGNRRERVKFREVPSVAQGAQEVLRRFAVRRQTILGLEGLNGSL